MLDERVDGVGYLCCEDAIEHGCENEGGWFLDLDPVGVTARRLGLDDFEPRRRLGEVLSSSSR